MNAPAGCPQTRITTLWLSLVAALLGVLPAGDSSSLLAQSVRTPTAGDATTAAQFVAPDQSSVLRVAGVGIVARRSATSGPASTSAAAGSWSSTPRWLRWGLVGAVAGAVTFPLLGGLSGTSDGSAAGDAFAGAAVGFIIVGGAVALWDALCAGETSSRRAGLCGR